MNDRRFFGSATLVLCLASSAALAFQTGTYRCFSHEASGAEGSCRDVRPLKIAVDGSYDDGSKMGTWRLKGQTVVLSNGPRGAGRLVGDNRLVFEYDESGRRHVVTFLCSDGCRDVDAAETPEGASAPAATPAPVDRGPATRVVLGLTLLFGSESEALAGARDVRLVLADRAAAYRDPEAQAPPPGSVTGRIVGRSADTLDIAFGEVAGGREYTLFLETDAGREEVAAFEVARLPVEQTIFVSASLGDDAEEPTEEPDEALDADVAAPEPADE